MSEELDIHAIRMRVALRQAQRAADEGEVPVGAAIYKDGHLIAQAHNQTETLKDATAHAEMIAITQAAAAVGNWRLDGTVLYVTKEPCVMCAGAIVLARIPLVVWGMSDPLRGGAASRYQILQSDTLNHRTDFITGVLEEPCTAVVKDFFRARRAAGAAASSAAGALAAPAEPAPSAEDV